MDPVHAAQLSDFATKASLSELRMFAELYEQIPHWLMQANQKHWSESEAKKWKMQSELETEMHRYRQSVRKESLRLDVQAAIPPTERSSTLALAKADIPFAGAVSA